MASKKLTIVIFESLEKAKNALDEFIIDSNKSIIVSDMPLHYALEATQVYWKGDECLSRLKRNILAGTYKEWIIQ